MSEETLYKILWAAVNYGPFVLLIVAYICWDIKMQRIIKGLEKEE